MEVRLDVRFSWSGIVQSYPVVFGIEVPLQKSSASKVHESLGLFRPRAMPRTLNFGTDLFEHNPRPPHGGWGPSPLAVETSGVSSPYIIWHILFTASIVDSLKMLFKSRGFHNFWTPHDQKVAGNDVEFCIAKLF